MLSVNTDPTPKFESTPRVNPMSSRRYSPTIKEDSKDSEAEADEGVTIYPYDRLTTSSTNPAPDIDVTKREVRFFLNHLLEKRLSIVYKTGQVGLIVS